MNASISKGLVRQATRLATLLLGLVLALAPLAASAGLDTQYPVLRTFFPQATSFGDLGGTPPAAAVHQGSLLLGYAFETSMVAPVPAYSGKPINILVAIDTHGTVLGAKVLYQDEPILLVGIPLQRLYDLVQRYVGHNVRENIFVGAGAEPGSVTIDAISGATVTSMVTNETIMNAAREVAASRQIMAPGGATAATQASGTGQAPQRIDRTLFSPATWQKLRDNGAISQLRLTRGEVARSFAGQPSAISDDDATEAPAGHEKDLFIDLYYADLTVPTVGRNILGEKAYGELIRKIAPDDEAISIVANGAYSFKGVGYVRGGIFDRIHVLQNGSLTLFKDSDFQPMDQPRLAGSPRFSERGLFVIRHGKGFDPVLPWQLQLLVNRQVGPLNSVYATFHGNYQVPSAYLVKPQTAVPVGPAPAAAVVPAPAATPASAAPSPALWVRVWHAQRFQIGILVAGLAFLTLLLTFQDWIVQRPRLLERLRVGFLIYTVVFIGWYSLAQLSIVNILTFIQAVIHGFRWETFLMDPLIFILWCFVAACLLFVGRGIFCGWLCPFGAMQELINKAAKRLKVPQLEPPRFIHERLWAIKYLILMGLFGLSLQSLELAERYSEVEPFKTAIILHFARSWGYVAWAGVWLIASAFTDKVYCRYICPLGAGLAVSGRLHLFEWLRRRNECGNPCQICAKECEVQAIAPTGEINQNECHYCLDCQVTYWNDRKCPPLVQRRKVREREYRPAPAGATTEITRKPGVVARATDTAAVPP